MWELLQHIYDGNNGGLGLLIAFMTACAALTQIVVIIFKPRKVK